MIENTNGGGQQPGFEQSLMERLTFASLTEQRKTRRWGIFFKLIFAIYFLLFFILVFSGGGGEPRPSGDFTALVNLDGVIMADSPASADYVITGLRAAFKSKAKGVILRTNSPGGSPVQSSYINDEITRLRQEYPEKAIYAVIGDICASGCYYAVAATDKIYASRASIVGSIGVLMDGFGFVDAIDKLGIERRLLTAGKNKGVLDPFSPMNPAHKRHAEDILKEIHQQFIDTVREGRGDNLKVTRDTFSGLFWTGETALTMGLVDELGSASHVAREVIGAEEIVDYTFRENIFDRFAQRLGTTMANTFSAQLMSRVPVMQ